MVAHWHRVRFVCFGIVAAAIYSLALSADACTCLYMTPTQALARADIAFMGTATLTEFKEYEDRPGIYAYLVHLTVELCWLGPYSPGSQVVIDTPRWDNVCGAEHLVGHQYLIFGKFETFPQTGACQGNRYWQDSYLQELGEPGCAVAIASPSWGFVKSRY